MSNELRDIRISEYERGSHHEAHKEKAPKPEKIDLPKPKEIHMSDSHHRKRPPLGSGSRFRSLTQKIEKEGKNPEAAKAIAASIGRKKYGAHKMAELSHHKK